MHQRMTEWFRRSSFPTAARAPLGWGAEYWDTDARQYEGWEALRDRHVALGRKWTRRQLALDLSGDLLGDVLAAAGGVEHSMVRFRSVVAELQQYCDLHVGPPKPLVPTGIGHPAATEAWYELANLLSWARALDERLDRR